MERRRFVVGIWVLWAAVAALLPAPLGAGIAHAGDEFTPPKPIPSSMVQPIYPAQENGRAAACTINIPVRFALDEKKARK